MVSHRYLLGESALLENWRRYLHPSAFQSTPSLSCIYLTLLVLVEPCLDHQGTRLTFVLHPSRNARHMSGIAVVDDQAVKPNSAGRDPVIEFYPRIPDGWVTNGMCVACNITHSAAQELLYRTVTGGTWTNAWWKTGQTRVTASLDFDGTSVAAYFVFFWRSEDPSSTGKGSLQFFIDNELIIIKNIDAAELTFQYDVSPRTLVFQHSNLDPTRRHRFTVAWVNDGPRPRVAVALDSMEYTPSPSGAPPAPTPSNISTSSSSPSPEIVKIVAPVVSVVAFVFLALGLFLWYRRRRRGDHTLFPPGSPELHPFVETSEGRRYHNVSGVHVYGGASQPDVPPFNPYQESHGSHSHGGQRTHSSTSGGGAASHPPPYSVESTSHTSHEPVRVALPHPQSRTKSSLPQSMAQSRPQS
ncbi:hypothetical protein FA13DRAFT_1008938 [Coprinellus micaceus]|uniref:Uncharacterized protein n=1 Tax=Coprinellus micaceus TaxID=71717 RepID=A0A4Y7SYF5_COPMI|nr:hypothetical protein FA13DRAFT_1008938 [Coprinellus micaceus]